MHEINNPARTTYFCAYSDGTITHCGITEPGQVTTSGQPNFYSSPDENEYLSLVGNIVTQFQELPAAGTQLQAGDIYSWNGIAVMVRQSHIRTEHDPDTVPALFIIHRTDSSIDWIEGEQVYVGTQRTFDGVLYEAIQAHVTQSDWIPPTVPALWKVVESGGGGGSAWVDTGSTVTGQAGQLFYISADISTLGLTVGQAIRFGDSLETTYVQTWPGTTTLMQINPYVSAQVGMKVWKWA